MNVISSVLFGSRVLEETDSKINGHIVVRKDYAWGTYIQANGLTQSGGVVETIWRSVFKKIRNSSFVIHNSLILGLGGGTVAKLVHKNYPMAKIVGVDIDPIMIELGNRHLALGSSKVKTIIADAFEFVSKQKSVNSKLYDLVIVDLYQGHEYPEKFESDNYIQLVRSFLAKDGVAIFNRLYFDDKRTKALKFGKKLEKVFSKVEWFYPEANLMFICQK
jgi:spermidine synthase